MNPATPDSERLFEKLEELLIHLKRPAVPAHDALWTNQDIADWLQLSLDAVIRRVLNRPDFPAPLQPCPTGQQAAKRWFAGEVIHWARQHRHRLPIPRPRRSAQSSRPATSDAVAL